MNKVLQNTLAVLGGVALGVVGFFLYSASGATTAGQTVSVTLDAVLNIADDATNITLGSYTPGSGADSSNVTTFTAESNNSSGFTVTLSFADSASVPGQLCLTDGAGGCNVSGDIFETDAGSTSSIAITTAQSTASTIGSLAGATFLTSTEVPDGGVTLFSATEPTAPADFDATYAIQASSALPAGAYTGDATITISTL